LDKRRYRKDQGQPDPPGRGQKAASAGGAKLVSFYMLMGQYDMAAVIEAPDDATYARVSLSLASKGGIRMETLRAFTEDEYPKIIPGIS
jgi:uncharacterized protein with GYD domain